MPSKPNSDHGSSFFWLFYFWGSIALLIFTIISFVAISKLLSVVTLIIAIFLLNKTGFINLRLRK